MSDLKPRMGLVGRVNDVVPFLRVCQAVGMDVPTDVPVGGSVKVDCPFSVLHKDHGAQAAFRVYVHDGFCFAGCGYFSSVGLAAAVWDVPLEQAAQRLADMFEVRVLDVVQWEQATERPKDPQVSISALAAALNEFCARSPRWSELQFDPDVAAIHAQCLGLLGKVQSAHDAWSWLTTTKRVMAHYVGVHDEQE